MEDVVRFAVVGCPACRRLQAVELRVARPGCRGCGKTLELASLKTLWRGDDDQEARSVVLRLSAKGIGIEDYARLLERIEGERTGRVEDAVAALASRSEFGREDLEAEMRTRRVPGDPDRVLGALVEENRVYEPRAGRYRFL